MTHQTGTTGHAAEGHATLRSRVAIGLVAALLAGVYTWFQHHYLVARGSAPDSLVLWRAANVLLNGENPWQRDALDLVSAPMRQLNEDARIRLGDPLFYPMPAVLLWTPLARLPFLVASTIFNVFAAFLFVFAITRDGLYRAWACGSVPFMMAMRFGQWSPLLVAAFSYPALSFFLLAKPNLGLSLYLSRPTRMATIVCAIALLTTTALAPWWVRDWLRNVQNDLGHAAPHPIPATMFGGAGAAILLALLRWRRPEARLVAFLACVPQLPYWADQLPLLLVPSSRREMQGMMLVTIVGFLCWVQFGGPGDFIDTIRPFAIVFTYAPAVLLVLSRRNERPGDIDTVSSASTAKPPAVKSAR